MPIGYLISTGLLATCTLFALVPPHPRRSSPFRVSFLLGFLVNELPFVAVYVLAASTALATVQTGVHSAVFWVAFGLAVLMSVGLAVVVRRSLQTGPELERALDKGLGAGWRRHIDARAFRPRRRLPLARILFGPFFFRRHDVERVANVRYGDAGRGNLLDLYRHRSQPSRAPTLVHLHGGAFVMGKKNRDARPLFYHLASQGWLCISANYRMRPRASLADQLIDVKKVVAWVRQHAHEYGADPTSLFVAGSSAGAHLGALAALTPNVPAFQPGFEEADTSIVAAICLYGYYGPFDTGDGLLSSVPAGEGMHAPPFFVAHGDLDTLVRVEDARSFVERLRNISPSPVVYAELPGAHHAFDLFHSIRFEAVVDAIEAFAAWVRS
ncbi:MAG: esterase [Candidatus Rokuibacteriota bacterium]|nr:MAG: esterase [Candidatus Rokubacteria bacterium]